VTKWFYNTYCDIAKEELVNKTDYKVYISDKRYSHIPCTSESCAGRGVGMGGYGVGGGRGAGLYTG
jgi:hypothetical protein